MRIVLSALLALLLLAGCAGTPEPEEPRDAAPESAPERPAADAELIAVLEDQHARWRGTPYRLGGHSRDGIDCSGFVQVTFRERLDRSLPRTTAQQARLGQAVARDSLETGDLVFFRTGGGKRHVGIYLEEGRFLHASTSRGVTVSALDGPYWSRHYWQARRL